MKSVKIVLTKELVPESQIFFIIVLLLKQRTLILSSQSNQILPVKSVQTYNMLIWLHFASKF